MSIGLFSYDLGSKLPLKSSYLKSYFREHMLEELWVERTYISLLLNPINENINLLIVEAQPSRNQRRLHCWVLVVPYGVLDYPSIYLQVIVTRPSSASFLCLQEVYVLSHPFVGTVTRRLTLAQKLPLHRRAGQIEPRSQQSLKEEDILRALGNDLAIDLNSNLAARGNRFDAFVRIFRMRT